MTCCRRGLVINARLGDGFANHGGDFDPSIVLILARPWSVLNSIEPKLRTTSTYYYMLVSTFLHHYHFLLHSNTILILIYSRMYETKLQVSSNYYLISWIQVAAYLVPDSPQFVV